MDKGKNFTLMNELVKGSKLSFILHQDKNRGKATLHEHTLLCQMYFESLWKEKNLGGFFLKFQNELLSEYSENAKCFYRQMVFDTVTFHELGRLAAEENDRTSQSYAMRSAMIYLQYFYKWVDQLESKEKDLLTHVLLYNTYIIANQTKEFDNYNDFLNSVISKFNFGDYFVENFVISIDGFDKEGMKERIESEKLFLQNVSTSELALVKEYDKTIALMFVLSKYFATQQYLNGKVFQDNDLNLEIGYKIILEMDRI